MPHSPQNPVTDGQRSATLVVCIGNELIADDAIGCEVYARLRSMDLPSDTRIEFVGVGGLALLDHLRGDERAMIVVDAVQMGAAAGTLHCLPWDKLPSFRNAAVSAHGIGLKDTIEVGRMLYPEKIPPQVLLVGIEGRCFDRMRDVMTPATAAAADEAAEYIRRQLYNHCEESRNDE
jgi:hydrogenase maturation protease